MKRKLRSLLLMLVIVLGMLPITASATETNNAVDVVIRGIRSTQISDMELYTYNDGEKGTENLLEGLSTKYDSSKTCYYYQTALDTGDYWLEGYDQNSYYNGGIKLTVTEDRANEFYVQRIYAIYCSNSGWVQDTDYTVDVKVKNGSVTREIETGQAKYGKVRTSCLFLVGDTVEATLTPIGTKASGYAGVTLTKTPDKDATLATSLSTAVTMKFVVPKDAEVDVGKTVAGNYYIYNYLSPLTEPVDGEDDGTKVWSYQVPKESINLTNGPYFFYRVQHEAGVTYWDFFDPNTVTETTVTLTEEDLYIGSEDFTKHTVLRDYSSNLHDTANIYMNINAQGYKNMALGDTYELNIFRNWQAIEHFYNRMIALPEVHYEILDVEGSDVISIEKDVKNSGIATMTAENAGTAIVLVTYDAMYSGKTMTDYERNYFYKGSKMSAVWPEFTGVFVVSVGEDGTSIDMGMTMDRLTKEGTLDAEHDYLFYTGTEGTSYTFHPEEGTTVTVNRCDISSGKMQFAGFTKDRVITNADGTVTIQGLTTGRHIIKVEKDSAANYQVISAREISYELQDAEGELLDAEEQIHAGDTIYIQYEGLINPCEKMAGIYNHAAIVQLLGEDETAFFSKPSGESYSGVYDFSSDPSEQRVEVTIPNDWTKENYVLDGAINMRVSGSAPSAHRAVSYTTGASTNNDAVQSIGTLLCDLPEITIPVAETFYTVTLPEKETGYTIRANEGFETSLRPGSNFAFTVKPDPGYVRGEDFAVKANGTVLTLTENDDYVLEYITEDIQITVEGVEKAEESEVTVYLTVSKGTDFVTKNQTVMALEEITVPYFDLAYYGLENVYYNPECYQDKIAGVEEPQYYGGTPETANGEITMLHLLIYATEVYCYDVNPAYAGMGYLKEMVWSDNTKTNYLKVDGGPGQIFLPVFWDFGKNLNYYLNYEYPLGAPKWGATCDQIVLEDHDVVSVRYNANVENKDNGAYYHFGEKGDLVQTVTQGDSVTLTLYFVGQGTDFTSSHVLAGQDKNVYVTADSAPASHANQTAVGKTNEKSQIIIDTKELEPGTYYVTANTYDPAVVKLIVEENTAVDVVTGDVNGDGNVTLSDAMLAYKISKNLITGTDLQKQAADVNKDGTITIADAMKIYKISKGLL